MKKVLFVALALLSVEASAQLDSGYYLGAAVGQMDYDEGNFPLAINDSASTYRIYGGFSFDEMWAMEAYYGQTGEMQSSFAQTIPGVGDFSGDIEADWQILQVRGIMRLKGFLVGLGYWDGKVDVAFDVMDPLNGAFSGTGDGDDKGYALIVGGEWEFDDWALRGEYEFFDSDAGADASVFSIGAHFKF